MSKSNFTFILAALTAIFFISLLFLIPLAVSSISLNQKDISTEEDSGRNERSTPRSFILPATPAVAREQQQEGHRLTDEDVSECMSKLQAMGYQADDSPPALTARNVDAIFKFQEAHHLVPTGRLNDVTMRILRCQ